MEMGGKLGAQTHLANIVREFDTILPIDLIQLDDDVERFRDLRVI